MNSEFASKLDESHLRLKSPRNMATLYSELESRVEHGEGSTGLHFNSKIQRKKQESSAKEQVDINLFKSLTALKPNDIEALP